MSSARSFVFSSRRALAIACGAAALTLSAAGAHAADAPEAAPTKTVRYADLNLSNPDDAAELYARLSRAARVVCRSYDDRALEMQRLKKACEYEALTNAVETVNAAALDAVHESESRIRFAGVRTSGSPRS
jgi:UrcA family protein